MQEESGDLIKDLKDALSMKEDQSQVTALQEQITALSSQMETLQTSADDALRNVAMRDSWLEKLGSEMDLKDQQML